MRRATLLLALLAACTSSASSGSPPPTASERITATATEANDGKTIVLQQGQELRITLSSTYWQLAESSNPGVLAMAGAAQVHPQPSTSAGPCVPGQGCGTATAVYRAIAARVRDELGGQGAAKAPPKIVIEA